MPNLDARRRQPAWRRLARPVLFLGALFSLGVAHAATAPGPDYPDFAEGTSALWLDLGGVAGWLTERAPLDGVTPWVFGLGFSHRIGPARLAWRAQLFTGAGDTAPRFAWLDLVSVERVYGDDRLRPWWRGALGLGLDLRGATGRGLGSVGYFNADNGAAGGLGLTAGAGLDVGLGARWFLRAEGNLRAYGAAGRTGVFGAGLAGTGYRF